MDGFKHISPTLLILLLTLVMFTIAVIAGFIFAIPNLQFIGIAWIINLLAIGVYHSQC